MKLLSLNNIDKLYFNTRDIARLLSISHSSAKVSASRYVKKSVLIRLKPDLYILASRLPTLTDSDRFLLANIIQTPSYVSLTTALSHFGITTQQQQYFIESIALKRTKHVGAGNLHFSYKKIKQALYEGFTKIEGYFIAEPEKALADAVYLSSMGKYNCDFHAIDFRKIKKDQVSAYIKRTNKTSILYWDNLCKSFEI